MSSNGDTPGLGRVLELAVTPTRHHLPPAVVFDQLNHVADLGHDAHFTVELPGSNSRQTGGGELDEARNLPTVRCPARRGQNVRATALSTTVRRGPERRSSCRAAGLARRQVGQ